METKNSKENFLQGSNEEIVSFCEKNPKEDLLVLAFEKISKENDYKVRFHFHKKILFCFEEQSETYLRLVHESVRMCQ